MQEKSSQSAIPASYLVYDESFAFLRDLDAGPGVRGLKSVAVVPAFDAAEANFSVADLSITKAGSSSGPGSGAKFIAARPTDGEQRSPDTALQLAPARSCRRRVLVVEDNRDSATSLSVLLELMGHEVRIAFTGPEALDVAAEWRPEITISDIGLPGIDGFEVGRRLRDRFGSSLLLVALTGYGSDEDRRKSQEAGFDHHLVKPADPAVIQRMLAMPR
jgi:CheY-like chemotaxis protein